MITRYISLNNHSVLTPNSLYLVTYLSATDFVILGEDSVSPILQMN